MPSLVVCCCATGGGKFYVYYSPTRELFAEPLAAVGGTCPPVWREGYSLSAKIRALCASTMLALGKQMKDIQMWLGHSDIGTTGNIYSHLDSHSKVQTGAAIYDALTD